MTIALPRFLPGDWRGARRPDRFWRRAFARAASALAMLMAHLKHGADGRLIHGPTGHLSHGCASGCGCASSPACDFCPDATPSQFHVTFTDVALCGGCVSCDELGVSARLADGAALDGTYLLAHNGSCAWTAFSTDVPCTASLYPSGDCSGAAATIALAVQQVRVNATQFRLQVTDDSNTVLLFDALVDAVDCCAAYTVSNSLSACGCGEGGAALVLATGGVATVTPC